NDQIYIPSGNFVLKAGDKIYITGSPTALNKFLKFCGLDLGKIKDVIIIGGGKITYYLAQQLEELGISIKIIEQDKERCLELSRDLQKAEIIHGDGANQDLLLEEGLEHAGAIVSLTDMDEENIVISMYASSVGVGKIITKVNSNAFGKILDNLEIGSIVSPKQIVVNRILPYVRAMNNAAESNNVETLYKIVNDQVEALEFSVKENTRFTGVPLKDLSFKPNILIAGIVRGDEVIIPSGNDYIQKMDNVIVVTTDSFIGDLGDILN
ncbi:MAG: NAD-binding protein, partial [Bacillota bacterium]